MAEPKRRRTWSEVKARLQTFDREGLVSLVADLYDASEANRRFLHSRLSPGSGTVEEYRRVVADAIYPDPFSTGRVRIRDAAAAITAYQRATADASGTVDLMLTFVEAGTEQAADLGYGDEAYFNALEKRLGAIVTAFDTLPATERANARARLERIQARAKHIGWGFGDAVDEVVHALDARAKRGRVDGR